MIRLTYTVLLVLAAALVGGCTTTQSYDGERRDRDDVAVIRGDFRFNAGAPVAVILRQVDGRALRANERSVEVLPGEHQLLVDCRIAETRAITRHAIDAEVVAGRTYRLVAETEAGLQGCSEVRLEAVR